MILVKYIFNLQRKNSLLELFFFVWFEFEFDILHIEINNTFKSSYNIWFGFQIEHLNSVWFGSDQF